MVQWILPKPDLSEDEARTFEGELVKARTLFVPGMDTPPGLVRFFIFTPEKSISTDIHYPDLKQYRQAFRKLKEQKRLTVQDAAMLCFMAWERGDAHPAGQTGLQEAATTALFFLVGMTLDLSAREFHELTRLSFLCTPAPGDVHILELGTGRVIRDQL